MDGTTGVAFIIALGGAAGIGAGIKAIGDVVVMMRRGMKPTERGRRGDLAAQRDEALRKLVREERRAMIFESVAARAKRNESRAREHAAELRVLLIERAGMRRDELPDWPEMEPDDSLPE